jgi:hypothetical protein
LKFQVLPSGEFVHDSAKPGFTVCVGTSKFSNPQNMSRPMYLDDDSSEMRKLNVFGSRSSQITNRPPRTPGGQFATAGGSGNGQFTAELSGAAVSVLLPQPERPITAIIIPAS